ncbi:MAG: GTP-binding protein [Firmicutes bacterium]|jgi:G3E family GTPase|nr:GTP-binding protein [Bacillota bacterium]
MIDVVLLTGFLGSGKTTCLNQLLPRLAQLDKRVVVVMNEFGSVGIDGRLIEDKAEVVELLNGSIFCVCIKDNFLAALARLAKEIEPEIVVIEATGVADPFEMGDFLAYPELEDVYQPHRTVTLVDAVNFPKVIQTLRAARAQAQAADIFVITKTDLLETGMLPGIEKLLTEINPTAAQIVAPFCRFEEIQWEKVLGIVGKTRYGKQYDLMKDRIPARDPMISITVSVGPFSDTLAAEEAITSALPSNVLRAKGFIDIGGKPHLFQYTMGKVEIEEMENCKASNQGMVSRVENLGELVLIGPNLRREEILQRARGRTGQGS